MKQAQFLKYTLRLIKVFLVLTKVIVLVKHYSLKTMKEYQLAFTVNFLLISHSLTGCLEFEEIRQVIGWY